MAKPTPLQFRNILVAALAAAGFVWSVVVGMQWWVSAVIGCACVLSLASAYLNRPGAN
ncbi:MULTISPECIES: hypothetical protein [Amycolatopsis]|uniref:Uncharacterized protein n=1 Tax=Amycolatopsis bullii TaxID=941987 RepID=A0ABQ3KAY4_9PSEU|nr:hypothetical protein [Amycolatopsis bullii]GHG10782.1 hypothetical protein GCM10017567_29940 [Amycolatopsis bullii]